MAKPRKKPTRKPLPRKAARKAPAKPARKAQRAAMKPPRRSPITPPFRLLIDAARRKQVARRHRTLGLNHWVTALRDLFPILPRDIPWDEMKVFELRSKLGEGEAGPAFPVKTALKAATRIAKEAGLAVATIEELALAIIDEAGMLPAGTSATAEQSASGATESGAPLAEEAPCAVSPTTLLDRFGRNLTREAAAGLLAPVVDRQQQIAFVIETLCRKTRRNLALIGPPGVGKRAIVEAVAQRIAEGDVPAPLKNLNIVEIQLSALLSGVTTLADLDERFGRLLAEACVPNCVLFFDELRTVTPAGHDALTLAISNQLKPELARGRITCIVSGAQEDYVRFVELDGSLRLWFESWFQVIRVDELSAEKTIEALEVIAAHARSMTGVTVAPSVLRWIVAFAGEFLKSHRFPGKAVDLLEQVIAHAISRGSRKVNLGDAREVAERAIAIPADIESRLRRITRLLEDAAILPRDDQAVIVDRLSVTLRSLDLIPARPNAAILLLGPASAAGRALAETLADAVAGSTERVIAVDFGLLTEPWDTRQLLGVPGPNGPAPTDLPLHSLIDEPWSIVLAENIDGCHAQVRTSFTRALSEGYLIDARGKKIYLSDAIVVLTAPSIAIVHNVGMGFGNRHDAEERTPRSIAAAIFDSELVDQMDLVVPTLNLDADLVALTRQQSLLADLTKRYKTRGLDITWDKSVVEWIQAESLKKRSAKDWQQWADQRLAAVLIPHLPGRLPGHLKKVVVRQDADRIVVADARRADAPS